MAIEYKILYQDIVVREHIPSLPKAFKASIKKAIETRLMVDPVLFGKPLQYSLKGHRRLRVGDYRIIYRIENMTVIIIAIKNRKDIYDA